MWTIASETDVAKRVKKHQKKHRRELTNVFDNFDTYVKCLQAGAIPSQIQRGFIHTEGGGVVAIDQKGPGAHLKQFRLYVFPDEDTTIVHAITLGDKPSQEDDIRLCKAFVRGLQAAKDAEAGNATDGAEQQSDDDDE